MSHKNHSSSKRKAPLLAVSGIVLSLAAVIGLVVFLNISHEGKEGGITEQVLSYSGYTRVIGQQEYDFYENLARREMDDISDSELLSQKTIELAQAANAQFYLGNKLGLIDPYTFEGMQEEMRHENARRKIDKENGQPIYGPESFDIYSYYQYVSSNLEVDIIDYLARHADEPMLTKARGYFEENKRIYDHPEQIVYSLTENGTSEEHTIEWRQLGTLENADPELAQILSEGSENQEFSYSFGDMERSGQIISISYVKTDFDKHKTSIVSDYLNSGIYKEMLQVVAKNNPVAFAQK